MGTTADIVQERTAPDRRRDAAKHLRVALFSANFSIIPDGASKALNRLVTFLIDQGATVRVYSPIHPNAPSKPGIEMVSVPSIPIPFRREYRLTLGLSRALREDIKRFNPTHVHISVPDKMGNEAQRYAHSLRVPVVASLHTRFETYLHYYGLGFLRPWFERIQRRFYSHADLVLAPNQEIAEELCAKGWARHAEVWHRGVDRSLFNPNRRSKQWRRQQGFGDDEIVLLFFGRLVREKGLAEFAAIIEELRDRGNRVRVLFVGEGPERARMEQDLPDAVFTGHLDGEELARAVASADILINPSVTEAFGNVNLEAMASGLAIVSADVPSAQALITNRQSGLLVNPAEPKAYVEAVEALIRKPLLKKALAMAAVTASATFDWNDLLGSVLDLYLTIS
jgi:phosphatidylinositol alpha 1,6-mannosyltransferase